MEARTSGWVVTISVQRGRHGQQCRCLGDSGQQCAQEPGLSRSGGAADQQVRVVVEVDDERQPILSRPDYEPRGAQRPGPLGDVPQRVTAQHPHLHKARAFGQLADLDRLDSGGVPQRRGRALVVIQGLARRQAYHL